MAGESRGSEEVPGYVSYLLRLWRERLGQTSLWRASLQDPHSGERVGFAHLDELFAYLRERTTPAPLAEGMVNGSGVSNNGGLTTEEGGSK